MPVLNRGDARIQVKGRCSAAVRNVQRKGQAGAIENSVVQGDIRMAALNLFADSQNVRLIDGVVFLLGMESRNAKICRRARRRREQESQQRKGEGHGELSPHVRLCVPVRAGANLRLHPRRQVQTGKAGVNRFPNIILIHQTPTFPAVF